MVSREQFAVVGVVDVGVEVQDAARYRPGTGARKPEAVIWEAAQHWAAEHVGSCVRAQTGNGGGGRSERAVLLPGSPGLMTIV
jgi:hypothetical protein